MNNLKLAGLVASLAVLGGCQLTQEVAQDDPGIMVIPDAVEVVDTPPTPEVKSNLPDNIPDWYINLPRDTEEKIYGSGAGLSSDLQFSMDKAMHQAKIVLGDKISTKVSAEIKTYMADNSSVGNGITVEETQRVSKSGFKDIDVSAYEIINKTVYQERNKFRSFILLSLDILNKEERKAANHVTKPVDVTVIQKAQDEARESMNSL
tara:strand:+ start:678 stop:1295 length:618 start_codon:yes stop_codon:yes gene_type:complete